MKILLLTDIPPCKNLTAGLVLDQLCRFLPRGSVACFMVSNPALDTKLSGDLEWIQNQQCTKPRENWDLRPRKIGKIASFVMENSYALLENRKLTDKIISFGRNFGATVLWCVLQGQTMIRLAVPVSQGLGAKLLTQVWDPPFWWLKANGVDRVSQSFILREFDSAIRSSSGCATASWAMADDYQSNFDTRTVPIIPSLDTDLASPAATEVRKGDDLIIGMAGQIYASEEWEALIRALDSVNWVIGKRQVRIRLMGRYANLSANGRMNIEFLGWGSQTETIKLMAQTDILYCPYWFSKVYETEARLSFPSKLTSYLASGRPVFFHGPDYSSPARFLKDNDAGLCCHSLSAEDIVDMLTNVISDNNLYCRMSQNGLSAFKKYLTLSSMRKSFAHFLQVNEDWLMPESQNDK